VSDRITFTRDSADRIAATVRRVEIGDRTQSGPTWDTPPTPGRKVFRVCTFTGAWSINTSKTVTFRNQTTTPNTVAAFNLFAAISAPSGAANCAIAKDGTAWYLIAAQC